MKNFGFFILILVLFAGFGCKKNAEPYGFYRITNKQNYTTTKGGELYAFTATDSVLIRADNYLKLLGKVNAYGAEILYIGHCWSLSDNPLIGVDSLMTKIAINPSSKSLDTTFIDAATKLLHDKTYYLRSYIIIGDGKGKVLDTGYNPVIKIVPTKDAIDQWFPVEGDRPSGARFGALGFNFGDSLFFGLGSQGYGNLTNSLWMYDPITNVWNGDFKPLVSIDYYNQNYGNTFMNGIGFGIEFTDIKAQTGTKSRCIYVGFGDYIGDDQYIHKSQTLIQYDFTSGTNSWKETSPYSRRSGAVCFVIGRYAYIGTGKSENPLPDWFVFDPALERDGSDKTSAWKGMGSNRPGGANAKGRVGAVAFAMNGKGYFGLGSDSVGNFLNDFWEFRPTNTSKIAIGTWPTTFGSWTQRKSFPGKPRANAVAFVIGDQAYVGTGDNIKGNMEGTYEGKIFDDLYRYDPYNDKWTPISLYTTNSSKIISQKITKAVAFSSRRKNEGYVGFGIVPDSAKRAQDGYWVYKPYEVGAK